MDIYTILATKPHNPHYMIKYITFIQNCQQKNAGIEGYTEKHHICPKAKDMFPAYKCFRQNNWNLAILTARQHFIAHMLLWKTYPNINSCVDAIWGMKCRRKIFMNSKLYERMRFEVSAITSSRNKGLVVVYDPMNLDRKYFKIPIDDIDYLSGKYISILKDKPISETHKTNISNSTKNKKLSEAHKTNISSGLKGILRTNEHKLNISKSLSGRKLSETHKNNISSGQLGSKRTEITKLKMSISQKGLKRSDTTKLKISESKSGSNHPRHKYFYVTPEGTFDSASSLINLGVSREKVKTWCILCDRIISKRVYSNSNYLQTRYIETDIIGKSYRDIGFYIKYHNQI